MDGFTKTQKCLVYLMACALHGVPAQDEALEGANLNELLAVARLQSVAAMVCMAMEKTITFASAEEATRKRWLEAKNKAVRKNMLLDAERKDICSELEAAGIWYMPLKGSVLKDWYPQFGMREMADNDILFDPSKRCQVRDCFIRRGYQVVSNERSNHDAYKKPPVYNFEMHVALFDRYNNDMVRAYEGIEAKLMAVEGTQYERCFAPEDFYVYAMAHNFKHYRGWGTGIRTLADIFVMNRHFAGTLNREYVRSELDRIGIAAYERDNLALAEKIFCAAHPFEEITLTPDEAKSLRYCLNGTAYGSLDYAIADRLYKLQKDAKPISGGTKLRYLLHRLFPSLEIIRPYYPFLDRHPWTFPAFWVWRLLYKGVTKRGDIRRELSSLKSCK